MNVLARETDTVIDGRMLIGADWCKSEGGKALDVRNPADGSIVGEVPDASTADAVRAVSAAAFAQPKWAALLAGERARILRKWAELVSAHREDLGRLLTTEQGKPLPEAIGEADVTADFIGWFAEEARRAYGRVIPPFAPDKQLVVTREPVGVAVAITPWNFPLSMVARKIAPALAAGCATILKPSEDAPFSSIALAELAREAGVPPGALNVITCSRESAVETVKALLEDGRVRKLSFTGSTVVGKILLEIAAHTVKRVSMELGGNAPFIVFDDADIDKALAGFATAKFRNAGQVCIAPNRLLVQQSIHDRFVERLTEDVEALTVGPGLEKGSKIGPLITQRGFEKALGLVREAVRDGAEVVTGGGPHALGGTFLQPTILTGINPQMRIFREEVFGPVVPVVRFADEDEAIQLANDTDAGLAAYFYTRDSSRVWRVSKALQSGMIGINDGVISTPVAPFGGVKESGLGREGGESGIAEYLEEKYLCVGTAN
jgi:succinate-semialdehyde dehydrogenase/glutarate-semialdehyde dehydrogenase